MGSSPPPPSFLLPPGTKRGGATEDAVLAEGDSPRGTGEGSSSLEEERRVSMYVRLFDEMITTVIDSEPYLFTPRELWVLRHILDLEYEPHYLLTRLLLRRPAKIHAYSSLATSYSREIGEDGVKRAMRALSRSLPVPQDVIESEPPWEPHPEAPIPTARPGPTPLRPTKSYPSTMSAKAKGKQRSGSNKPWASLASGLTPEEEKADPHLAEALKESLWASKVGRVEVDGDVDEVRVVHQSPSETPTRFRGGSASAASTPSLSRTGSIKAVYGEEFSLSPRPPPPITALARDEKGLALEDLMSCMSADELRKVARERKIPLSSLASRESTITALRAMAKQQSVLGFTPVKGKSKSNTSTPTPSRQSTLSFAPPPKITSETLLTNQLLAHLGESAIQITSELHSLIARVNLIFSRTPPLTAGAAPLMLPAILVTAHKRRYPDYGPPTRSTVWKDREELLRWERAAGWEALVSDALGETWDQQRKNPAPGVGWAGGVRQFSSRAEGAKVVRRVWEGVWEVWKGMVEGEKGEAVDSKDVEGGLVGDRFKTGHVLTRIVYKGATALGILHEYDNECMVLRALLAQRRWRRGKRGAWYDRLALVLMTHYKQDPESLEEKLREATQVCIDGLLDEDTHLIYRPALSRRLTRLEKKLNLPPDERHISFASLLQCETRELSAPRLPENTGVARFRPRSESVREPGGEGDEDGPRGGWGGAQLVGKSLWVGKEGEVSVEGWVLEWWEKKGYKGFHSESSILTTLFTLLMWPVLFHPLPGAFETPYQTAPLDLGEDTFAPSRSATLEARLEALSKTSRAIEMLREVDGRERPRGTWAVGVDWEYGAQELEEILECLGGKALSGVCRMLAEEYRHRASGVPDLIVWNPETKEARFVEVKGPGDSLSETQKIWIDVLLSSGIPVEVCRVKAQEPTSSQLDKLDKKREANNYQNHVGKRAKRDYSKAADGEYVEGAGDERDEEDEGWEKEDEMRYESGGEGKGEGKWAEG
ncbi:hypothetical protein IAT38_004652 [Cryptococcus sp. DSM 104549]